MLQKKYFAAALGLLSCILTNAQTASVPAENNDPAPAAEEKKEPVLSITGSVDAYYKLDFAKTTANSLTSFTQTHNSFSLGMASIKFEHKGEKVSAVADLGFGPRARDFAYTDNGITQAVKQLYVSYSPAEWLKLSMGTWGTHVGYELLDPQLNRNYSMSYMFTNGPFSHTGIKAEMTEGKHSLMLGLANATDYRIPPGGLINKKFMLAQYSYAASDNVKIFLNYAGGQSPDTAKTSQFDAVVTAKLSDKFNIGFNGTVNSTKFWDGSKNGEAQSWGGAALYFNLDPKPWYGLTLRTEYFSDKNQLKPFAFSATGGSLFATTLSASFKTGGFIFIPEIRLDNADKNVLFVDKNGAGSKSATSFLIAAIYSF